VVGGTHRQHGDLISLFFIFFFPNKESRLKWLINPSKTGDWLTGKLLLVLASTVILGSESHGTHVRTVRNTQIRVHSVGGMKS
jgi:hypothetical protein